MRRGRDVDSPFATGGVRVALAVLAIAAPAVYLAVWGYKWGLDLQVYRDGTTALFGGHDPYNELFTAHGLPYSYPPPALVLLAPLNVLPSLGTRILWWVVSAGAVAVALATVLRTTPEKRGRRLQVLLLTCAGCLLLEPARSTLDYGQVNAVLFALVVADVLVARRYRGVGVGIAAAIKLTPLFFVVFFVLDRDWPAVRRMAATFAVLVGGTWLLFPRVSTDYWFHQVFNMSRPGNVAFVGNQSLLGALHRLPIPAGDVLALWALGCALVVAAVVLIARHALRHGARVVALFTVALGGLLISPISWSHHWIWICLVPALGMVGAFRQLAWPLTARIVPWCLVAVGVLGTYWWGLQGPAGTLANDGLVAAGLAVLAVWAVVVTSQDLRERRATSSRTPSGNGGPDRALTRTQAR
jgi:alpha-1,2-mannosyltransferase